MRKGFFVFNIVPNALTMSELPKRFSFAEREDHIYRAWEDSGAFAPSTKAKTSFAIAMPPPNANGSLHLGHASMLAYQDIMVRFHRMRGEAVVWVPGTDHAGIQSQVVFERYLKEHEGKTRHDLGRETFFDACFAFCMENKKTITSQIRKMGASCDWQRERFTLDPELLDVVIDTFVRMYEDGLVYRAKRIINWCPRCGTSLSDIEVLHEETNAKLYYIKYGPLTLATVRPETKFGDTALAVHPDDARYKKYVGKTLTVQSILDEPVEIRVIADAAIDPSFGTGVVKVTPAHDALDFEIGERHHLEVRSVIDEDGKLTALAGKYAGRIARDAREDIVRDLDAKGLLDHVEDYVSPVAICERCKTPIEPNVSLQWWIKMNDMAKRALAVVRSGDVDILPERFKDEFFRWLEGIRDWNISRQIWWGPRLPIWYCDSCERVHVQKTAPTVCAACGSTSLTQDPDTFDTWFSSAQWPFSIFGGPEGADFKKFYPTDVMETGWDIIFFWVARMLMVGLYRTKKIPFRTVYLHGLVLDEHGKKMSKSKGNVIDPLAMITKYGTDALRLAMVSGTTPGQNVRLYEEKVASFRNFQTKLWNIGKFIEQSLEGRSASDILPIANEGAPTPQTLADRWILSRLQHVVADTTTSITSFQFGSAIDALYRFLWHDFADWYIETCKVHRADEPAARASAHDDPADNALAVLIDVFRTTLTLLHPFAPFVTEELWQRFFGSPSRTTTFLMAAPWPSENASLRDETAEQEFAALQAIIKGVRECRALYRLPSTQRLMLIADAHQLRTTPALRELRACPWTMAALLRLASIAEFKISDEPQSSSYAFAVSGVSFAIPLDSIDVREQRERFTNDIERDDRAIARYEQQLVDNAFLANAPTAVIDDMKAKLASRTEERDRKRRALDALS